MSGKYQDDNYIYHHLEITKYTDNDILVECLTCGDSNSLKNAHEDFEEKSDVYEQEFIESFCQQHKFCMDDSTEIPSSLIEYKEITSGTYCSSCSKKIYDIEASFIKLSNKTSVVYILCYDCAKEQEDRVHNIMKYDFYNTGWSLYCGNFMITTDRQIMNLEFYERFGIKVSGVRLYQNQKKNYHKVLDNLFLVELNGKSVSSN